MLERNRVYEIDVLEGLANVDNNTCDIIIADPPYNIGKNFGNNTDKMELKEYVEWSKKWINECIRVLKPSGTMFIYGFDEILAYIFVEIPINKRWLIWHYTNKTIPHYKFWQRSHESIICCWKEKYIFNVDEVRVPYTESFVKHAMGKVRKGTEGRFGKKEGTIYGGHPKGALPKDVICAPALAGGAGRSERWFLCKTCNKVYPPRELKEHENHDVIKHPTQKPLTLCDTLIRSCMPMEGGLLLVPFAGVGSECVSAKRVGLNFIGFEINPDYIKIAEARLKIISNNTITSCI